MSGMIHTDLVGARVRFHEFDKDHKHYSQVSRKEADVRAVFMKDGCLTVLVEMVETGVLQEVFANALREVVPRNEVR